MKEYDEKTPLDQVKEEIGRRMGEDFTAGAALVGQHKRQSIQLFNGSR